MKALRTLRSVLDRIYFAGGVIAAFFLLVILFLIVVQMLARWTGEVFSGAPDYAGYSMAAASFFAFAHALNRGAHIRVNLLLNVFGARGRRVLETWCFTIGTALAWYLKARSIHPQSELALNGVKRLAQEIMPAD